MTFEKNKKKPHSTYQTSTKPLAKPIKTNVFKINCDNKILLDERKFNSQIN